MNIIELPPGTFTSHGDNTNPVQSFPLGGHEGGYFVAKGNTEEEQQAIEKILNSLRARFGGTSKGSDCF